MTPHTKKTRRDKFSKYKGQGTGPSCPIWEQTCLNSYEQTVQNEQTIYHVGTTCCISLLVKHCPVNQEEPW